MKEVASHLLLYKMFDAELDVSLCYPFWFISTIIQFYICWPLIVRILGIGGGNSTKGLALATVISLSWATVVGVLGYEDMRPWGSCFLQYLWEFVLGMFIAQEFNKTKTLNHKPYTINQIKWWWLIGGVVVGMGLTGVMGWIGGVLKLYNDIPSLMGYLSLLLIVYKVSCTFGWLSWIKKFFVWASGFGYELYLVHSLVYAAMGHLLRDLIPHPIWLAATFLTAYTTAWTYHWLLSRTIYRK